ncbi:unnamed protein product [Ilex paraguariensis]|uniref:Uncharacterized protein n=1 Tax=Ilex paraguariensis TaxID=185542 RepID=A0ABC8RMI3_9AQUA
MKAGFGSPINTYKNFLVYWKIRFAKENKFEVQKGLLVLIVVQKISLKLHSEEGDHLWFDPPSKWSGSLQRSFLEASYLVNAALSDDFSNLPPFIRSDFSALSHHLLIRSASLVPFKDNLSDGLSAR